VLEGQRQPSRQNLKTLDDHLHHRKSAPKIPKILNLHEINKLSAGAGLDPNQNEGESTAERFTPSHPSGLQVAFSHADLTSKLGAANMVASKSQRQLPALNTDRGIT